MLGQPTPREVAVVPIVSHERVLALVYAQMGATAAVPAQVVGDLEALAEGVRQLLARLTSPA
jgi:hypothetical protein